MDEETVRMAEEYHYKFQLGMYFSDRFDNVDGCSVVYSDIIDDFFWNYATNIEIGPDEIESFVNNVESFLMEKDRLGCFYLTDWSSPKENFKKYLENNGYLAQFHDSWMFLDPGKKGHFKDFSSLTTDKMTFVIAEDPVDFLFVFSKAYGGEDTENDPYGGLPPSYIDALKRSFGFDRPVDTYHFVAYTEKNEAASIGTLVYSEGWGCIYNVGTDPMHRKKGFGRAVSYLCINKWESLGGQILFLMTEVGSNVEKWYSKMGFVKQFNGEGWAKE